MSKKKPQLSFDDWMDRDDDFVHRGGLRSGWDEDYSSTTDYVLGGFLKPVTPEGEIREIRNLCLNRANILAGDKKIRFRINPEEKTANTDGRIVTVGTAVLDETRKTFAQKADIMVGLTTHEMAHILHSNFAHLKKVQGKLHKAILNVIEDERIEYLLCQEFPGYATNIADLKKYFLDEKYIMEEGPETGTFRDEDKRRAAQLFDMFFKMVRYPKLLDKTLVEKYQDEFDQIKKILNPYPMTAAKTLAASTDIYEIIKGKIEDIVEEEYEMKTSKSSETPEDKTEEGGETSSPSDGSGDSDASPKSEESKEKPAAVTDRSKEIEEMLGEMMRDFESDNDSSKEVEVSSSVKEINFDESFIYDDSNKAVFRNGKNRKDTYDEYLNEVRGDAGRLANSLFTHVFNEASTLKGLRSGTLDENRIVEAIHGVKTVHLQRTEKQTKSINIVMLIDESGSMKQRGRFKDAARAAVLIERAFHKFPVGQLFIYGFTGDIRNPKGTDIDYNLIIRYREPGLNIPYGLGDIDGRANNRDGECIRAVANRVRQFTNEPMIFFMISDGQPAAIGYSGFEDTRKAVTEISKRKFFPIQVGIGDGITPEDQAQMFDDFINYREPKKMVEDLRKIIVRKASKVFGI